MPVEHRVWPGLAVETKGLLVVLAALGLLSAFRAYHYFVTGFLLPDEFAYFFAAMHSQIFVPDRWFFGSLNAAIFRAFGVNSIDAFVYLLPFYLYLWSGSTVYWCYRILKLLDLEGRTISLVLVTSVFVPTFTLLSLGFLTETMALFFAMLGIYFLLLYAKGDQSGSRILLPLLSSLAFSAASGTREPYLVFSIGGIFLVWFAGWRRGQQGPGEGVGHFFPVILFAVPAIFFLQYPSGFLANTLVPLAESFFKVLSSSLSIGSNQTSTTIVNGSLVSPATFSNNIPGRLGNTLGIFMLGMLIGWEPILLGISLVGTYFLLLRTARRQKMHSLLLIIVLLSFCSYLGTSYLVSWDPTYLTFTHYSTVLRLSNTALPAFFLGAPFFFSRLIKSKRRALLLVGVLVLVTLPSITTYESSASSNLYAGGNPFLLSYRTPAAEVRDYLLAHPAQGQSILMGVPPMWSFTPGVQDLPSVEVFPYINQSQFITTRWPLFYIYVPNNLTTIETEAPYLLAFVGTNETHNANYVLLNRNVVLQNQEFSLIRVTLKWP